MKLIVIITLSLFFYLPTFAQEILIDLSSPEKAFDSYITVCKNGTENDLKKIYLSHEQHQQIFPSENYYFKPIETLRNYYKYYEKTTKEVKVIKINNTEKTVSCKEKDNKTGITVRIIKIGEQWYAYDSTSWHRK